MVPGMELSLLYLSFEQSDLSGGAHQAHKSSQAALLFAVNHALNIVIWYW